MANKFHAANKRRWEAGAADWARRADNRGTWRRCHLNPRLVLCDKELGYLHDIRGKRVCVLGSGDNQAAFALAGLGAKVTSVDISANQLAVAQGRAEKLGLSMSFVQSDVTNLGKLPDRRFDAIYTGGHVAVWVSDLKKYYDEAARVLKPGGLFIVNEYHPLRRIWKTSTNKLAIGTPYLQRGPFTYTDSADVLQAWRRSRSRLAQTTSKDAKVADVGDRGARSFQTFEFHWTIGDYLNCVIGAGCELLELHEYGEHVGDWEGAPMAGLPEFLLIIARKKRGR